MIQRLFNRHRQTLRAPAARVSVTGLVKILQFAMLLQLCFVFPAQAEGDFDIVDQPLPNGDFSNGLSGWTVVVSPATAVPAGSVSVVNDAARLAKGGAFVTELSQGFAAPEGLQALRLTLAELPVFGSSGSFIPEAFDVHLIGSNGFSRTASFQPGASAAANSTAVPSGFNLADGVTLSGASLRIALDDVAAGEVLEFAVTLAGASADTVAHVAIDNVVLEVEDKVIPDRIDGCGIFRDRFQISHGVAGIARCALGQINDTGIEQCLSNGGTCSGSSPTGEDAEFGRDRLAAQGLLNKLGNGPAGFDYTKLDAEGNALPDSATEWACVRDNYAGLIWEVKVDDPASPRHFEHTYSWYQPDGAQNGGQAGEIDGGSCSGGSCDLEGLIEAVNANRLCGATDWRVPTRPELLSLVNASRSGPAISTAYFPRTSGAFWSLTPVAADPAGAWRLDFDKGEMGTQDKTAALKVRLVREAK